GMRGRRPAARRPRRGPRRAGCVPRTARGRVSDEAGRTCRDQLVDPDVRADDRTGRGADPGEAPERPTAPLRIRLSRTADDVATQALVRRLSLQNFSV